MATYKAQFLQMAEAVQAIQDKLEIYEKYENIREREFRELEREVYKLKQLLADSGRFETKVHHSIDSMPRISNHSKPQDFGGTIGTSWLR